jgi:hypothetical protein
MGYSPTLPEDKHKRFHDRASAARYVSEIYNRHTTKRAIARWPIPGRILLGRFMMTEHDIDAYILKLFDDGPAAGRSTREMLALAREVRPAERGPLRPEI